MAFSEKYVDRTLELHKEHGALKEVFRHLEKEFPGIPPPNEKTVWKWRNKKSKEDSAKEQVEKNPRSKSNITATFAEHFDKISGVATEILGGLGHIHPVGKYHYKCYSSEKQSWFHNGILTRNELIDALQANMIKTKKSNSTLIRCFITHLKNENPEYENLYQCLVNSPEELVTLLQIVESRKQFQGECDICKGMC